MHITKKICYLIFKIFWFQSLILVFLTFWFSFEEFDCNFYINYTVNWIRTYILHEDLSILISIFLFETFVMILQNLLFIIIICCVSFFIK